MKSFKERIKIEAEITITIDSKDLENPNYVELSNAFYSTQPVDLSYFGFLGEYIVVSMELVEYDTKKIRTEFICRKRS